MSTDKGRIIAVKVTSRHKNNVLENNVNRFELMPSMNQTYSEARGQILAVLDGIMMANHVIVSYEAERERVNDEQHTIN